jgi:hypothetical protein
MLRIRFFIFFFASINITAYAGCFDLIEAPPTQLSGVLTMVVFPGRPNYSSVEEGDEPEKTYILRLDKPICSTDQALPFDQVHLVSMSHTRSGMKDLIGKYVQVQLTEQMPGITGHHHAPLVAWVQEVHRVRRNLTH